MHLTESCDDNLPQIVTNVETTPATTSDNLLLGHIHQHLVARQLSLAKHIVDAGYVTCDHLVTSLAQATDVIGPVIEDQSWQARAGVGFGAAHFVIDWDAQHATCRVTP